MLNFPLTLICTYFFSRPVGNYEKEKIEKRFVDCYEVEVITESQGGMFIDEVYFPVKKGDVVFRYPGQTTQGVLPYSCYAICFQTSDSIFKKVAMENIPSIFHGDYTEPVFTIVEDIFNESLSSHLFSDYFFQYQLAKLLYIFIQFFHPNSEQNLRLNETQNPYVTECKSYIQTHWRRVIIDDLVKRTGVSKSYLMKIFKKQTGKTILNYIDEIRIMHIKKLLIFTNDNLTTIAAEAGFKNSSYFSNYFFKHVKQSPKDFRKLHKGEFSR